MIVAGVALHPNEAPRLAAAGRLDEALDEIERLAHDRLADDVDYRLLPGDTVAGVIARTRTVVGDLPVQVDMVGEGREATPVSSTSIRSRARSCILARTRQR